MHISQFSSLSLDLLLVFEELVQAQICLHLSIPVDIVCELLTLEFSDVLAHIRML